MVTSSTTSRLRKIRVRRGANDSGFDRFWVGPGSMDNEN